jgi:peptidyl-prolyl cis-trans isomerase B (cyclophilin B)
VSKQNSNLSKAAKDRIKNYDAAVSVVNDRPATRKRDNLRSVVISVAAIVVALGLQFTYFSFGPGKPVVTPIPTYANSGDVPPVSVAENRDWTGSMKLNKTELTFKLDGKNAPQAVAAFVTLAKKGFYQNNKCHRLTVTGIYVLQCGDPKGDGTGGPGFNFGPIENAPIDDIYRTGYLAFARTGGNGFSMGSQFFIVYTNSTIPRDAAGGYTVFGVVDKGLEEIYSIAAKGIQDGSSDGKPVAPAVISDVTVK